LKIYLVFIAFYIQQTTLIFQKVFLINIPIDTRLALVSHFLKGNKFTIKVIHLMLDDNRL